MRFSILSVCAAPGLLGSVSGAALPNTSPARRDLTGLTLHITDGPLGPSTCKGNNDIVPGGWHAASLAPKRWDDSWSCGACVKITSQAPSGFGDRGGMKKSANAKVGTKRKRRRPPPFPSPPPGHGNPDSPRRADPWADHRQVHQLRRCAGLWNPHRLIRRAQPKHQWATRPAWYQLGLCPMSLASVAAEQG